MRGGGLLALAAALMTTVTARVVQAHGSPAAVVRVIAADAGGPWLLGLTEGLAQRSSTGWRFVCPSRFGLDAVTLSEASSDGQRAWVVGDTTIYELNRSAPAQELTPGLVGRFVLALSASTSDGAFYALRFDGSGSELLRLREGALEAFWSSEEEWQTLTAVGEELLLASAREDGVELARVSLSGELIERSSFEEPGLLFGVTLRSLEDRSFASLAREQDFSLLELSGNAVPVPLLSSPAPIEGPVLAPNGDVWAASDGRLFRVARGQTAEPMTARQPLTCLAGALGRTYACARTQVLELTDTDATPAFDLGELRAPALEGLAPKVADRCVAQWRVFQTDLPAWGYSPDMEMGTSGAVDASKRDASGCSMAHAGSHSSPWIVIGVLVPLLGMLRRRP